MTGRILVTGASGFVGTAVVRKLHQDGQLVRAAVHNGEAWRMDGMEVAAGFDLARHDNFASAVAGVACVIHAAGLAHAGHHTDDETVRRYTAINTEGTLALARASAAAGVRRFVFLSTITVHGLQTEPGAAFTEDSPIAPANVYARSKAAAEQKLRELARVSAMEVTIIRPPLIHGPGVKGNLRTTANWIRRGIPLPFGSLTTNRRTLVGIDNLVDLISVALHHPRAANETFVAADDEDLSTRDLFARIGAAMGKRPTLVPIPETALSLALRSAGMSAMAARLLTSLRVDAAKSRRLLDWTPRVSVEEGLRRAFAG